MSTEHGTAVYRWIKNAQFWILPGLCVLCARASGRHLDLCESCEQALPIIHAACVHCALPLPPGAAHPVCGACQRRPPPFRYCITPLRYEAPADRLIAGLKFHGRLQAGKVLAHLLAQRLRAFYRAREAPTLILPVPLHTNRLRARGFNQARELAREVGARLAIPVDWRRCARSLPTRPQTGLSARERRRNLRAAFRFDGPPLPPRVALLDDVVTTGSTAGELSRLLLANGAREVDVWAAARAT